MSSLLNNLSVAQLKRAVAIKEQIEKLESELSSILGKAPKGTPVPVEGVAAKKRTMSAAARAKISAAQKARHAARREAAAPEKDNAAVSKRKGR